MLQRAFKLTLPIFFGYVPSGIALGLLLAQVGIHWGWAAFYGFIVASGSAQFLGVGFIAARAGFQEVFIATTLLCLRHAFYGLSIRHSLVSRSLWRRLAIMLGLTDELFAVLTHVRPEEFKEEPELGFYMTALIHLYWGGAVTLGALAGEYLPMHWKGLEFVLVAMMTVLALEQYLRVKAPNFLGAALLVGVVCQMYFPEHMLPISMGICALILFTTYQIKALSQAKAVANQRRSDGG